MLGKGLGVGVSVVGKHSGDALLPLEDLLLGVAAHVRRDSSSHGLLHLVDSIRLEGLEVEEHAPQVGLVCLRSIEPTVQNLGRGR